MRNIAKWFFLLQMPVYAVPEIPFDEGKQFSEGVAWVWREDEAFRIPGKEIYSRKFALINKEGKVLLPLKYTEAGDFREGVAPVAIWNPKLKILRYGVIDKKGKWLVPPKFIFIGEFRDGLAVAVPAFGKEMARSRPKYKRGYIDVRGKWIIPPIYSSAADFCQGSAEVNLGDDESDEFYINKLGQRIDDPIRFSIRKSSKPDKDRDIYKDINAIRWKYAFHRGYERANREGLFKIELSRGYNLSRKYGFFNSCGRIVIPRIYDDAEDFSEGYAFVAKIDKNGLKRWGYIDTKGRVKIDFRFILIRGEFGYTSPGFSDGLAYVYDGNSKGYIDKTGEFVIRFKKRIYQEEK